MEFKYTQNLKEGNHCADKLASLGLDNKIHYKWLSHQKLFLICFIIGFNFLW